MTTCGVDGCEAKHYSRGWCRKHYLRWRRHGNPFGRVLSANPSDVAHRDWLRKHPGYYKRYYTPKPQVPKVCELCGEAFSTARVDQRFCSDKCGRKYHSRKHGQPWNDRRRTNAKKRRAIKRGVTTGGVVSLEAIRERDQGRCGICGGRVNGKAYPHPLSASLDHIVPLSVGGTHDPANVHLTHLRCNLQKGNRGGGEQLRIFG